VLTQYKGQSLIEHVQRGWGYLRGEFGEFVSVIPAQQQIGPHWYQGTADAVYQNLEFIRSHSPKYVLILAGDHIYTMDYGPMIAAHVEKNADVSIGVVEVPKNLAREYGVLSVDTTNRVIRFNEKPKEPETVPGRPDIALASMGIYIFNVDLLDSMLTNDAAQTDSSHDFGKNIIPIALESRAVYAYAFQDVRTKAQAYWRDVGTLDAYYEANMELVHVRPELNIYDDEWPIWTYQLQRPPAKFILDDPSTGRVGSALNSMVSAGCIISGASVRSSLLFSDVRVEECSVVEQSVLLPRVSIGRGCVIRRAILDEGCIVPDDMQIGVDAYTDASRFEVTEKGVVLVTAQMLQALV